MPSKLQHEQAQHVEYFRKYLLRKRLLQWASSGAAYVPFIGDGDLAVALYSDRWVFGADLKVERVEVAATRVRGEVRHADCNVWPFHDVKRRFAIADFDPYASPFDSFKAFWSEADKKRRLVCFFTDGIMLDVTRMGRWTPPDDSGTVMLDQRQRAAVYHFYLSKHVWPWFEKFVRPYRVLHKIAYRRSLLFYWGVVLER